MGLAIILIMFAAGGCTQVMGQPDPTPLPAIHARELLLDAQPFPANWDVNPCAPDCSRRERETRAFRTFSNVDVGVPGRVIQEVIRLGSVAEAQAMYERSRDVDFRKGEPPQVPSTELLPPPEISYRSPIADEYYFGCGIDIVPVCRASIRYGQYFVSFFFDIDGGTGEGMEIKDVEPILRAMDAQASARLGIPLSATTPSPSP